MDGSRKSNLQAGADPTASAAERARAWLGLVAPWWGLAGILALLAFAIVRLSPLALDAFRVGLSGSQWAALALSGVLMTYFEGYRGFQRSFSPRVAERAAGLRESPAPVRVILAPFYCAGYFAASRRVKITAYSVLIGVVVLIQLVHFLAQPWRGIVDFGVVLGLAWGLAATGVLTVRALEGARTREA